MNALVVIETLTPAVFAQPGGVDAMLESLIAKVRAVETDVSTPAGRKAIASLAHQVARSKTAFDDMGKNLVADLKKQTGAVDAERKKVRDRLDALKDEVRAPLDEYEAAEAKRIAEHQNAIQAVIDLGTFGVDMPASADVVARLTELDGLPDREWQEFKQKAVSARSEAFARLHALKIGALAREAEAAELARLRAEEAARIQRERDDRIAAEAAARATREAEERSSREAAEVAARAEAEQRRVEREAAEATRIAAERERQAELIRQAAVARAEKAERDAVEATARAERDRVTAIEAERKRVADTQAAEAAETARREADKKHREQFESEALAALVAAGLSESAGVTAITAIARGNVPHVKISY